MKGGVTRYAYDECIQLDAPYKIGPPNAETETRNSQTRNRLDNRWYVVCGVEVGEREVEDNKQRI